MSSLEEKVDMFLSKEVLEFSDIDGITQLLTQKQDTRLEIILKSLLLIASLWTILQKFNKKIEKNEKNKILRPELEELIRQIFVEIKKNEKNMELCKILKELDIPEVENFIKDQRIVNFISEIKTIKINCRLKYINLKRDEIMGFDPSPKERIDLLIKEYENLTNELGDTKLLESSINLIEVGNNIRKFFQTNFNSRSELEQSILSINIPEFEKQHEYPLFKKFKNFRIFTNILKEFKEKNLFISDELQKILKLQNISEDFNLGNKKNKLLKKSLEIKYRSSEISSLMEDITFFGKREVLKLIYDSFTLIEEEITKIINLKNIIVDFKSHYNIDKKEFLIDYRSNKEMIRANMERLFKILIYDCMLADETQYVDLVTLELIIKTSEFLQFSEIKTLQEWQNHCIILEKQSSKLSNCFAYSTFKSTFLKIQSLSHDLLELKNKITGYEKIYSISEKYFGNNYEGVPKFLEKITFFKRKKRTITIQIFRNVYEGLIKYGLDFSGDLQFFNNLRNKTNEIEGMYAEIQNDKNVPQNRFLLFLNKLEEIPLDFIEIQDWCRQVIETYNSMSQIVSLFQNPEKPDEKVHRLIEIFENCKVHFPCFAKYKRFKIIQTNFSKEDFEKEIFKYEEELNDVQILNDLELNMEKNGIANEEFNIRIFKMKVKFYRLCEKHNLDERRIYLKELKRELFKIYLILENLDDKKLNDLREDVEYLEKLIINSEEYLRKIIKEKDHADYSDFIIYNFIDISEELINIQTQYALNPNVKIEIEDSCQNFFGKKVIKNKTDTDKKSINQNTIKKCSKRNKNKKDYKKTIFLIKSALREMKLTELDVKKYANEIEANLFLERHYENNSEKIIKLLQNLCLYPLIKKKLLSNNFSFDYLKKLIKRRSLTRVENSLALKEKKMDIPIEKPSKKEDPPPLSPPLLPPTPIINEKKKKIKKQNLPKNDLSDIIDYARAKKTVKSVFSQLISDNKETKSEKEPEPEKKKEKETEKEKKSEKEPETEKKKEKETEKEKEAKAEKEKETKAEKEKETKAEKEKEKEAEREREREEIFIYDEKNEKAMTPEFNQETERNDIFIDEEPKFQHMEIEISSPEKKIDLSSSDADSAKINLSRQIIEPKNMGFNKKKNKKISNLYLDEDETKKNDNQIIIGNTMGMTMIETEQKTVNDILFEEKETFILNKKTLLQIFVGEINITPYKFNSEFLVHESKEFLEENFPSLQKKNFLSHGFTDVNSFYNFYEAFKFDSKSKFSFGFIHPKGNIYQIRMLALDMNQHNIVKGFKFGKGGCATVNFISPNHMRRNKAFEEFRCFVNKAYNYSPPLFFLIAVKKDKLQIKEQKMTGEFFSEENLAVNKKKYEPPKSQIEVINNPILHQKNENQEQMEKNENNTIKIPQKARSNSIKHNESLHKSNNSEEKREVKSNNKKQTAKITTSENNNNEIDIFKNLDETDTQNFLESFQNFNPNQKTNVTMQENVEFSNSLFPLERSRIDISLDRHIQKQSIEKIEPEKIDSKANKDQLSEKPIILRNSPKKNKMKHEIENEWSFNEPNQLFPLKKIKKSPLEQINISKENSIFEKEPLLLEKEAKVDSIELEISSKFGTLNQNKPILNEANKIESITFVPDEQRTIETYSNPMKPILKMKSFFNSITKIEEEEENEESFEFLSNEERLDEIKENIPKQLQAYYKLENVKRSKIDEEEIFEIDENEFIKKRRDEDEINDEILNIIEELRDLDEKDKIEFLKCFRKETTIKILNSLQFC